MATAQTRASRKYSEKAYARLSITIPKGRKKDLEEYAKSIGDTLNGLTNKLYMKELGISDKEWKNPDR